MEKSKEFKLTAFDKNNKAFRGFATPDVDDLRSIGDYISKMMTWNGVAYVKVENRESKETIKS